MRLQGGRGTNRRRKTGRSRCRCSRVLGAWWEVVRRAFRTASAYCEIFHSKILISAHSGTILFLFPLTLNTLIYTLIQRPPCSNVNSMFIPGKEERGGAVGILVLCANTSL